MNQNGLVLFILLLMYLLLSLFSVHSSPIINEIMYAPPPLDDNEWIEIYNPLSTPLNLIGWQLTDNKKTNTIVCCPFNPLCSLTIPPQSYALLTDQKTTIYTSPLYNITLLNITKLCVDANSIGTGLGNTGDNLTLHNLTYQTSMNYTNLMGGNNNYTLERNNDNSFTQSLLPFGTPGKANSLTDPQLQYQNLIISEILANPLGEDNLPKPLGEWIELYNQGSLPLDLQSLHLKNNAGQTLILSSTKLFNDPNTIICPGCYKVIYRDTLTSFTLDDTYDQISLYKDQTLLASFSYSNAMENMSFSYTQDKDSWEYTIPTPNKPNIFTNLCDLSLEIILNQGSFTGEGQQNFTVVAKTLGNIPQKISVHGVIRNAAEDILREYAPWNNNLLKTNFTKTYTPILYPGIHSIEFSTVNQSCIDINQNNNNYTEFLGVESMEFFDPYSQLYIENIKSSSPSLSQQNKTTWGDHLDVSFFIYKGDETKNSGKIWAQKDGKTISEPTTFLLPVNHQVYLMTLPLFLKPNCDHKITDGEITIFLEAVNLSDNRTFLIENISEDSCQTIEVEKIIEKEIKVPAKKSTSSSKSTSKKTPATTKKNTTTTKNQKATIPKLPKNSTKSVTVTKQEQSTFFYTTPLPTLLKSPSASITLPQTTGITVYESNSAKTNHLIPYLLLISFIALCIITLRRT